MPIPVTIQTDPVPDSYCVEDIQTDWPKYAGLLSGTINADVSVFNYGNLAPSPDNQQWPWFRLNANGTPDKWYAYSAGSWLSYHPSREGTTIIYTGSEASIDTFDGGEVGEITAFTGPMWQKVAALDGRFPVGVGTLGGSDLGTAVTVGESIGTIQANFKLQEKYMPALKFLFGCEKSELTEEDTDVQPYGKVRVDSGSDIKYIQPNTKATNVATTNTVGNTSLITDEVIPPSYGVFFIARTGRDYYRL